MTWTVCQTVPVLLPEDSGLRREFLTRRTDWGRPPPPLRDNEYAQYDSRTVFYDVFRREENPRRVVAIGPPPVNLAPELHGLRISRAGRALRYRLCWYPRFTVAEIMLDRGAGSDSGLELDFVFPSFAARVRVPPPGEEEEGAAPRPAGGGRGLLAAQPIAMMTLQKDNEIAWIEDWCRWHRRLHDVTRFRIYDNGSANIGPLEEALRGLSAEMDIALVRWPYPYGPNRSDANRFSQTGAFNHYRLRFGARDAWSLIMDVDEYLAASGERSLREVLAASERRGFVSLHVDSFTVPSHPGQGRAPERRIWRHAWRERDPRGYSEKCIFVPRRIAWNMVHRAWPRHRLFERWARWPNVGSALLQFWYGRVPARIERMERDAAWFQRAGAWLLRRVVPGARRIRLESLDDFFFFHFRGLNTDWRPGQLSEREKPFDPERHVEDPRMRALAEQAGLVPEGAPPGAGAPKGEDARGAEGGAPPARAREGTRA